MYVARMSRAHFKEILLHRQERKRHSIVVSKLRVVYGRKHRAPVSFLLLLMASTCYSIHIILLKMESTRYEYVAEDIINEVKRQCDLESS